MPQIKKAWPRIRKVDNGEGRTCYSVDLRPHGPRKYFATEAQAKGEAQIQRIRLMNEGAESFQFSAEQRTDARAALHILDGTGLSLLQAAKIARDFHGLQTSGRLVGDAVQALLENKSRKSPRYQKDLRLKLASFVAEFGEHKIAEVSSRDLKVYLSKRGAPITQNNHRSALSVLFSFAKKEEWIAVNPVEYVTPKEFDQKAPGILDLDQIKALLKACVESQPDFVTALTLALFAGLRPESELWHIERKHVDLAKGEIDVHRSKSKGSTRFIRPEPVLLSWLKQYLPETGPVSPRGDAYYSRLLRVRESAGLKMWPQDVLRHSFASYHYARFGDENKTRQLMGHYGSVHTFLRHYKNRVRDEEAEAFWKLGPTL